jgi:hypothetical protein
VTVAFDFNPDEARDAHGMWTDGGSAGPSPATGHALHLANVYRGILGLAPPNGSIGITDPVLEARANALSKEMGGRTIDLTGATENSQAGALTAMENFHAQYPDATFNVDTVPGDSKMLDGGKTIAETYPGARDDSPSTIYLNQKFFGNDQLFQQSMDGNRAAGFLTDGNANPAQQTVDHELGHVLANSLGYSSQVATVREIVSSDTYSVTALQGISKYATQSGAEFIGESFANSAGPSPTPLASLVRSDFSAAYHQRYG